MPSVTEWLGELLAGILNSIIEAVSPIMTGAFLSNGFIFSHALVQQVMLYAQILATVLLTMKLLNDGIQTYYLYRSGDPDADPRQLIINGAVGVAVIWCVPAIVGLVGTIGNRIVADVRSLEMSVTPEEAIRGIVKPVFPGALLLTSLFTLILCGFFLAAIVQTSIRSVEVALLAIVGPVLAVNAASSNRALFNSWVHSLIVTTSTQAIQLFMLKMCLFLAVIPFGRGESSATGAVTSFLALGWLIATVKTYLLLAFMVAPSFVLGDLPRPASAILRRPAPVGGNCSRHGNKTLTHAQPVQTDPEGSCQKVFAVCSQEKVFASGRVVKAWYAPPCRSKTSTFFILLCRVFFSLYQNAQTHTMLDGAGLADNNKHIQRHSCHRIEYFLQIAMTLC